MRGHDSTQPENAPAAGEAWWTGQASLTINRRSRPAPGSAQVAQLVEHATENRSVGGSIPPLGTKLPPYRIKLRILRGCRLRLNPKRLLQDTPYTRFASLSRRLVGRDLLDLRREHVFGRFEIETRLNVHPERSAGVEELAESQRGIGRNGQREAMGLEG
jgi:hypothetical protein